MSENVDKNDKEQQDETVNQNGQSNPAEGRAMNRRTVVASLIIGLVIAALMAVLCVFVLKPLVLQNNERQRLKNLPTVTVVNHETVPFNGTKVQGATDEQKALAGVKKNTQAVLVFASDKNPDVLKSKTLDVYVDVNNRKSKDFLALNRRTLENAMLNSNIVLKIHPVALAENQFTPYCYEALAQVATNSPEKAWNYLYGIIKISNADNKTVDALASRAEINQIPNVTVDSINSGSYAAWLLQAHDDKQLKGKFTLPMLVWNGERLDEKININNTEELAAALK